ncbi:MAG: lysine--tRNA ligase [Vampirovibrionales bacterium]|nr:lysine--tRNA ligase [Vampirovibrionales bacterium]
MTAPAPNDLTPAATNAPTEVTSTDLHGGEAIRAQRIAQLAEWHARGQNPFPYKFVRSSHAQTLHEQYESLEAGGETQDRVQLAGRIMAIRNSGMFLDLKDETGRIQIVCHKDYLSAAYQETLKWLDIGDCIGVTGIVRRTPRGELSVRAEGYELLAKALLPLPEKHHGLTDIEVRTRQRYVDLIVNEDSRQKLRKRCQIVSVLRRTLEDQGFLEVETPMLHPIAGGAAAKPFITHHNTLDTDLYLRIAPELYLKRLIAGGLSDKLFELNRCFRNEGISPKHNPEFTSVEIYQAYADYFDMMTLSESLVCAAAQAIHGTLKVPFGDQVFDFTPPWPRKTMCGMIAEKTGIDFMQIDSHSGAFEAARKAGVDLSELPESKKTWGHCVAAVFEARCEQDLIQPTHVIDFPQAISPLAKIKREQAMQVQTFGETKATQLAGADSQGLVPQEQASSVAPLVGVNDGQITVRLLTERFESYVNGWEIANAFSELTNPLDQRARFESQLAERAAGDDEAHAMDDDYINAMEYGLPPTGGLGLGIDRLAMLLTDTQNIRDIILFPTLRPKKKPD